MEDPSEFERLPLLDAAALAPMRGLKGDTGGDLLEELAELFEAQLPGTVVDLETALEARDAHALEKRAHQLKGFAATVGASRLAWLAAQVEARPDTAAARTAELVALLADCYRETAPALRSAVSG